MPQDLPSNVSEPVLVVTVEEPNTRMPVAPSVPHAPLPVIVKLPEPVAEILEDEIR